MSAMRWSSLGLGITLLYLIGAVLLVFTNRPRPRESASLSTPELMLCVALLAAAAYLRFWHVETLHGGHLTSDEAAITRTYVSSIVHFEPVITGGTYLTHAWLLDTWYRVFGISTYSARYYTATVSFFGLVCFFAALRCLFDARIAIWATVFLAISTYAVYFSVYALETAGLLLFVPLNALLLVLWLRRPSLLRSFVLGSSLGLSLFTYPGVILGYVALLAGWFLCWTVEWIQNGTPTGTAGPFAAVSRGAWLIGATSFAAVALTGIVLHNLVYFQYLGLFRGGGRFITSYSMFKSALPVLIGDVFVKAASWNLLLPTPFVDRTFWPFALLGAFCLWSVSLRWMSRGVVLSPLIAVLLVPFGGPMPGMRRGLYILFPLSACAGVGVHEVYRRLGPTLSSILVMVAVAHPLYYQMTIGRQQWTSAAFGQDFGSAPIPDAVLLDALEKYNVVMVTEEFQHPWDRLRHIHYRKLAVRHGVLHHPEHTLTFVSEENRPRISALAEQPDTALLTWARERVLLKMVKPAGLCFRFVDLDPGPTLLRLTKPANAERGDLCLWTGGEDRAVTSCVRLGYRYRLSRLVHGVVCSDAACDVRWPESVFVQPGSVSFRLKRPEPRGGAVRLVLKVADTLPLSENRVSVNDRDLGLVDRNRLERGGRLVIDVPAAAQLDRDVWSVRIGPGHREKTGWEVLWAALEAGEPADTSADECPATLCVKGETGEFCDDGRSPGRPQPSADAQAGAPSGGPP